MEATWKEAFMVLKSSEISSAQIKVGIPLFNSQKKSKEFIRPKDDET